MKRLDSLVFRELLGPWLFGVALFSALVMAATYLGRLTNYMAQGVPPTSIMQLTVLLLPAVLVKTFAMAMLLAALLAFGRLSGDSEIVAIRAAGASLPRIIAPVAAFAIGVAAIAFATNEVVVPAAAHRAFLLQNTIVRALDVKSLRPLSYPIKERGEVVAMVTAKDFSPETGTLRGATIIVYGENGGNGYYMEAKELAFDPKKFQQTGGGWRIRGGGSVVSADGETYYRIDDEAWPPELPNPDFDIDDLITGTGELKEFDLFSMSQLQEQIQKEQARPGAKFSYVRNLEYWYWNKIALPLAAMLFGVLGAVLGVRHHRAGAATGFALTVAILFGYTTITNFMNVLAGKGVFPPYVASFTPLLIGSIVSGVVLWRRNA